MEKLQLELYLQRIGAGRPDGNTGRKLENLKQLHQLHPKNITFENIDSFTGEVPSLKSDAVFNKLVTQQRGGYCYEHNLLFKNILTGFGFAVNMHLARVLWNSTDGVGTARSHMLLSTDIDGEKYLVDVGFGSMTLTSPVLLRTGIKQDTPNGVFRLQDKDGFYQLEVFKGEWLPIYKFSLEEIEPSDLEMANWYVATGPDSIFNRFLMITRVDEEARYALFNTVFSIRRNDGTKESFEIKESDQLKSVLATHFHLDKLPALLLQKIYEKLIRVRTQFNLTD